MRNLMLSDFMDIIGGKLIKGNHNVCLKKIATWPQILGFDTLCFDLFRNGELDLSYFERYENFVIVTDRVKDFEELHASGTIVEVDDRHRAYWRFIEYYRSILEMPIIGVAGTCGKTTTKEMIKHILSVKFNVCSTYESNNVIQFNSMYLLKSSEETDFGVFEMGLNKPGDLAENCRFLRPQIRVLLNIGLYHLDGCKTPEEYIKAKAEILEGMDSIEDSILIINGDDNNIKKVDIKGLKKIIRFGFDNTNDIKARSMSYQNGGMSFIICFKDKEYNVFVPGYGRHNVYNALAAIIASVSAGISIEEAIDNISRYRPVIEHLQLKRGVEGCTIIDDTWSSAPPSVEAALEVLKEVAFSKKRVAVIGMSPLLGDSKYAKEQYRKLGEKAVNCGVDILITAGSEASEIVNGAIEFGMDINKVYCANSDEEIFKILRDFLNADSVILLKITHRQIILKSYSRLKTMLEVE